MKNRPMPPEQQRTSKRAESEELANGLDPATDDSIDSDGDGWADWKEQLAGRNPRDYYSIPINYDDGSAKILKMG